MYASNWGDPTDLSAGDTISITKHNVLVGGGGREFNYTVYTVTYTPVSGSGRSSWSSSYVTGYGIHFPQWIATR